MSGYTPMRNGNDVGRTGYAPRQNYVPAGFRLAFWTANWLQTSFGGSHIRLDTKPLPLRP